MVSAKQLLVALASAALCVQLAVRLSMPTPTADVREPAPTGTAPPTDPARTMSSYDALSSWPALPSNIPSVEGALLVPLLRGEEEHSARQERVVLLFNWDPVEGAKGLAFPARPPSDQAWERLQARLVAAVAVLKERKTPGAPASFGELMRSWPRLRVVDSLRVHSTDMASRWFVVAPYSPEWDVAIKALRAEGAPLECKTLGRTQSGVELVTSSDLPQLLRALLLLRDLHAGEQGPPAVIVNGYSLWSHGDLEMEINSGLLFPCDGVQQLPILGVDAFRELLRPEGSAEEKEEQVLVASAEEEGQAETGSLRVKEDAPTRAVEAETEDSVAAASLACRAELFKQRHEHGHGHGHHNEDNNSKISRL